MSKNNMVESTAFKNFEPYQIKKNEEYMNEAQLDHFTHILTSWRDSLRVEFEKSVSYIQGSTENHADPADRATQEEELGLELRTRNREQKLIQRIELVLKRVREKDYGYCDICGIEIGLRRLEARPIATQCIECKTVEEMRERHLNH